MRMCELIWDLAKADQVQALVEESSGEMCPCMQGRRCPLIPDDVASMLAPRLSMLAGLA